VPSSIAKALTVGDSTAEARRVSPAGLVRTERVAPKWMEGTELASNRRGLTMELMTP
jgi:hypothetical protein